MLVSRALSHARAGGGGLRAVKIAGAIALVQLILYLLLCVNFRACAQANIPVTLISDFLIASMNFFVIRKIATSPDSKLLWVAYTLGSVAGSAVGIRFSQWVLGA